MVQKEAVGRLNLYDDVTPLPDTKSISILVDGIRKKTRGADVREAIATALEVTYETAASEGNANMEVAKARATFDTLAERLANMSDKLDDKASATWVENQLNNILSSGPTAALASLTEIRTTYPNGANGIVVARDTGKWYYWDSAGSNWTEGGNYQSRAIGGNEVSADHVDFVQGIKQLLIQKIDGGTWMFNSSITTYESAEWSRYAPVNLIKGKTYYIFNVRGFFSHVVSVDGTRRLKQLSTSDTLTTLEYTATEDSLLYVSTRASDVSKRPKVFNASLAELKAANVNFENLSDGYVAVKIPNLVLDVRADDLDFVTVHKQLLDEATITTNAYYPGYGKATSPSPSWVVYPPVNAKAGVSYGLKDVRGVFTYFFNVKDQLVKKFATSDTLVSADYTPSEDGYFLITRHLTDPQSKVVQGGLSKISMLPNLDYGASAMETTVPFVPQAKRTDYHVKKDGTGDFTSLATALAMVGEGTKEQPLTVYVHSGTYDILAELGGDAWLRTVEATNSERLGLVVPDYVNIVGIGDVKLHLEVPDDKTTINTAKRISLLNVWKNNVIKNLKLYVRNTRYAVHDETNNAYHGSNLTYIDCCFEHKGNKSGVWQSTQAYAAGTGSGGHYLFDNCTFKSVTIPFSMHDNENQNGNVIKLRKCTFITGHAEQSIRFGSHGANTKQSTVTIENCNIDKAVVLLEERTNSGVGNHFKVSGGGNTMVPYININSAGRKERVEFADEVRTLVNSSQTPISIGTLVKLVGNTIQPLGVDEPWLFYGLSLDEIVPGQSGVVKYAGYIAKADTGLGTLSPGQRLGVVNGRLSPVEAADFVAYATDGSNILIK